MLPKTFRQRFAIIRKPLEGRLEKVRTTEQAAQANKTTNRRRGTISRRWEKIHYTSKIDRSFPSQ